MRRTYASLKRRERLLKQPVPLEVWMRRDGMSHAQPHLLSSPVCLLSTLVLGVVMTLLALGIIVWQLSHIFK
jgi:hypothetical protein